MRGYGGIGRHARLRGVWLTPCEFESRYPHRWRASALARLSPAKAEATKQNIPKMYPKTNIAVSK